MAWTDHHTELAVLRWGEVYTRDRKDYFGASWRALLTVRTKNATAFRFVWHDKAGEEVFDWAWARREDQADAQKFAALGHLTRACRLLRGDVPAILPPELFRD